MTALAANFEMKEKAGVDIAMPVVGSDIIYKGALCKIDADGYLAPCASEAGSVFAGVAMEKADNSAGSSGDIDCVVRTKGIFLMTVDSLAQANVGDLVYATDDNLVTVTSAASKQIVGRIVKFYSASQVWVQIGDLNATTVGS